MGERITFLASFPMIQSAIKVGDLGMRFQLDVPESEMANALPLIAMRDKVLRVTVEVDQPEAYERTDTPKRGAARRRE